MTGGALRAAVAVSVRTAAVVLLLLSTSVGCSLLLKAGDPDFHKFFEGCFQGDSDVGTQLTLILRRPEIAGDPQPSLEACGRLRTEDEALIATLAGSLAREETETVELEGVFDGTLPLTLTVTRSPAGEEDAVSLAIASDDIKFQVDPAARCAVEEPFDAVCPSMLVVR